MLRELGLAKCFRYQRSVLLGSFEVYSWIILRITLEPLIKPQLPSADLKIARTAVIGEDTVLGEKTSVGEKTVIQNSVIGSNCQIGANVRIQGSYIWNDVKVGNGAVVTSAVVCDNVVVKDKAVVEPGAVLSFKVSSHFLVFLESCLKVVPRPL